MHITKKKCLGLILLSGLLLLALLQVLSPWTHSGVDIQQRQGSSVKKLLDGKIQDIISGYRDIAYHTKEDVAWCVISQNTCYFVYILLLILICIPFNSLSIIYIPDAVVWLKIHVCVWLMRRPFTCRSPICCSRVCGPIMLVLRSWSPTLTLKAQSVTELRSTAALRGGKVNWMVNTSLCNHVTVSTTILVFHLF